MHPIDVIVPVYNAATPLSRLANLLTLAAEAMPLHLTFINDASTDEETNTLCEKLSQRYRVIVNTENLQFSRTVNVGINHTEHDVLLLNQDVWWETSRDIRELLEARAKGELSDEQIFAECQWIAHLQERAYSDEDVLLAFPKYVDGNGLVNAWAFGEHPHSIYRYIEASQVDVGQYPEQEADECAFSAVYFKRQAFDQIGLLDETMLHYLSDTDYCLRVRNAGKKILMVDGAMDGDRRKVRHDKYASSPFVYSWGWMDRDREVFREKWPLPDRPKLHLKTFYGFLSGYSNVAANIYKTLTPDLEISVDGWGEHSMLCQPITGALQMPRYQQAPELAVQKPDSLKSPWIYTMLETNTLPPSWVRILNECEGVVVPAEFNRQTFTDAGVTAPLHVMHPPFDDTLFQREGAKYRWRAGSFVILSVFEWGLRKFPEWIKIAGEALRGRKDIWIVLVTRGLGVDAYKEAAKMTVSGGPHIDVVTSPPSTEVLGCMYRSADLFVLPSRGEGWGIPYVESMSCGCPVIATNWSGNTEFMTQDNSLLVDYDLVRPVSTCPYYQQEYARWAEPKRDDLTDKIRWAVNNPDDMRQRAEAAHQDVQQFTIANQREKWLDFALNTLGCKM